MIAAALLPLLPTLLLACGDKDDGPSYEIDDDLDGWTADEDCDDSDASVHPDATEYCNGVDDDCNGEVDDRPADGDTFHADADADGYGDPLEIKKACEVPEGYVENEDDCDDFRDFVYPGADETCNDRDDDCDGDIDEDAVDGTTFYADADEDGWGSDADSVVACEKPEGWLRTDGDCDDAAAEVNPDATETCNDVDDDCDDEVDEDASDGTAWYTDSDDDGYGDPETEIVLCDDPGDSTATPGDCDDIDDTVYPGAPEVCGDLTVNDCDGTRAEAADECGGWGGTVPADDAWFIGTGLETGGGFGAALDAGADVDGDGRGDAIIGAPYEFDLGAVYVVTSSGLATGDPAGTAVRISGTTTDMQLGAEVAFTPDIDGDDVPDILIAATRADLGGAGQIYVLPGGRSSYAIGSDAIATWSGLGDDQLAGVEALAAPGDVTGDGVPDILAGAAKGELGGTVAGEAYLLSGAATGDNSVEDAVATLYSTIAYGTAADRVNAPGDLDGDGVTDFVLAATTDLAWIVSGDVTGDLALPEDADAAITDDAASDLSDSDAWDLDGDGYLDLAVGEAGLDGDDVEQAGRVSVLMGPITEDTPVTDAALSFSGETEAGFFGGELAFAPDIDGDGRADLVVGSGRSTVRDGGLTELGGVGQARVFFHQSDWSGAWLASDADILFQAEVSDDPEVPGDNSFGMDLTVVGDLDGDGDSELLIGAPGSDTVFLFGPEVDW